MKYEEEFLEICKEFSLKKVFVSGFNAEQIFYQIDPYIEENLENLEKEINLKYKKFLEMKKNNGEELGEMDEESSEMNNEESRSEKGEYSNSYTLEDNNCSDESFGNEELATSQSECNDQNESEESEFKNEESEENEFKNGESETDQSNSDEDSEKSGDISVDYSEERTVSFDKELWDHSQSSDTEYLNKPASEVGYLLWGNKKKSKKH